MDGLWPQHPRGPKRRSPSICPLQSNPNVYLTQEGSSPPPPNANKLILGILGIINLVILLAALLLLILKCLSPYLGLLLKPLLDQSLPLLLLDQWPRASLGPQALHLQRLDGVGTRWRTPLHACYNS